MFYIRNILLTVMCSHPWRVCGPCPRFSRTSAKPSTDWYSVSRPGGLRPTPAFLTCAQQNAKIISTFCLVWFLFFARRVPEITVFVARNSASLKIRIEKSKCHLRKIFLVILGNILRYGIFEYFYFRVFPPAQQVSFSYECRLAHVFRCVIYDYGAS